MKRRSGIRRIVKLAVRCLGAGAAATVLVSWGFALWDIVRPHSELVVNWTDQPPSVSAEVRAWLDYLNPTGMRSAFMASSFHGIGTSDTLVWLSLVPNESGPRDGLAISHRVGWPIRCLRSEMSWRRGDDGFATDPCVYPPFIARAKYVGAGTNWSITRPGLPIRPIPLGFAVNTLFYSTICAAVFLAPLPLRRALRRRRGLCPKCAYSLTGLAPSAACPECGHS